MGKQTEQARGDAVDLTRMPWRSASVGVLLAALTLSLTGCPSSPCSGEFISLNESCAPGCPGIYVLRYPSAPCAGDGGENVRWCVPPGPGGAEDIRCILDEDTDTAYQQTNHPDSRFVPANVRRCTDEEASRRFCSNP